MTHEDNVQLYKRTGKFKKGPVISNIVNKDGTRNLWLAWCESGNYTYSFLYNGFKKEKVKWKYLVDGILDEHIPIPIDVDAVI